ncbi:MAG: hypothetical protein QOI34_1781 [Verrucomicrobiota bacterium]|jgi:hypothetical protein
MSEYRRYVNPALKAYMPDHVKTPDFDDVEIPLDGQKPHTLRPDANDRGAVC